MPSGTGVEELSSKKPYLTSQMFVQLGENQAGKENIIYNYGVTVEEKKRVEDDIQFANNLAHCSGGKSVSDRQTTTAQGMFRSLLIFILEYFARSWSCGG